MSHNNANRKTILFGALIIAVLIGICFFCVTLYAKKEISKPKFTMPELPAQPSVTALPTDKDEAYAYVQRLYDAALAADDVEGSWHTDVRLDGEWELPFAEPDAAAIRYIRDHAAEKIAPLYPSVSDVLLKDAPDVPLLGITVQDVLDFTAEQGHPQDDGTVKDDDRYFITLIVDPKSADAKAMAESEVCGKIAEELSPVAALSDTQIEPQSITMRFTIDRVSDQLLSCEIERDLLVTTNVRLTDDAAALLRAREAAITLPYGTTLHMDIKHFGARFLERAIAVNPGDMKALPAEVKVDAAATKADYTLTFTPSVANVVSFDEDGVMNVDQVCKDPVTITMTLEYDGHTYTDELIVYITEWEVATNVGA